MIFVLHSTYLSYSPVLGRWRRRNIPHFPGISGSRTLDPGISWREARGGPCFSSIPSKLVLLPRIREPSLLNPLSVGSQTAGRWRRRSSLVRGAEMGSLITHLSRGREVTHWWWRIAWDLSSAYITHLLGHGEGGWCWEAHSLRCRHVLRQLLCERLELLRERHHTGGLRQHAGKTQHLGWRHAAWRDQDGGHGADRQLGLKYRVSETFDKNAMCSSPLLKVLTTPTLGKRRTAVGRGVG